jgi:hypothetical protein
MTAIKKQYVLLFAAAMSSACAGDARAQRVKTGMMLQDSARIAGERTGKLLADSVAMPFAAPVSFLVGVPVGFFGTITLAVSPLGHLLPSNLSGTGLVVAAGVGAILLTTMKRVAGPTAATKRNATMTNLTPDSLFRISRRGAYDHRIAERRATRILLGGTAGVGLGVYLLFRMLPYT